MLFKFRSLDKYAIDILVNNRLHLADWEMLNDPHEAQMLVENIHANPKRLRDLSKNVVNSCYQSARVCALSNRWHSNLLWSHYAAGHKGIAIGLKLPVQMTEVHILEVDYDDAIPKVELPVDKLAILNALKHKSQEWKYEDEVRLVSFEESRIFIEKIRITEVIFGLRTSSEDITLVMKLLEGRPVKFWKICIKPRHYQLNKTDMAGFI